MAVVIGKTPVYMRIGNGREFEIGTLEHEADTVPSIDGALTVEMRTPSLAEFLRAAADAAEQVELGQ